MYKMFSLAPWDYVHRSHWYPNSMFENRVMGLPPMFSNVFPRMRILDDDDFFKDLPQFEDDKEDTPEGDQKSATPMNEEESDKSMDKKDREAIEDNQGYSSYSYSSSSVLDRSGNRVENVRRRYEDSNGRLKAIHERRIGDKVHRSIWNRKDKKDKGKHETICNEGDATDFDELWSKTAFGKANTKDGKKAIEQESK